MEFSISISLCNNIVTVTVSLTPKDYFEGLLRLANVISVTQISCKLKLTC